MNARTINHVFVLSFYHPWFGAGAHRPRLLAKADIAAGRSVDFIFLSDSDFTRWENASSDEDPDLDLYRLMEPSMEIVRVRDASERGNVVVLADLVRSHVGTSYCRIHNPSRLFKPLAQQLSGFGIPVIYDRMDNWSGFAVQPWGGPDVEQMMFDAADGIVAVSEKLTPVDTGSPTLTLANAVRDDFVEMLAPSFVETHATGQRARALFIGAMWPDWFDWDLIQDVAKSNPDIDFRLVGPVLPPTEEDDGRDHAAIMRACSEIPNVHFVGEKSHAEILGELSFATVGLIPFKVTAATVDCSPLKAYEYLAAGLPIVATPLTVLNDLPGVRTGVADEWNELLRSALDAGANKQGRLYALENTWSRRNAQLTEWVSRIGVPSDV